MFERPLCADLKSSFFAPISLKNFLFQLKCTMMSLKPSFHIIVTVGELSPRQPQGHIRDSSVKKKRSLSNVSNIADQTRTLGARIERAEMSLKPGFH